VGVQEAGAPTLKLHEAPRGKVRLNEGIVKASSDFYEALQLAVRAGRSAEDDTKGHALASDPAMLAVQNRFIEYARKKWTRSVKWRAGKARVMPCLPE
jgi:hypothetical protein